MWKLVCSFRRQLILPLFSLCALLCVSNAQASPQDSFLGRYFEHNGSPESYEGLQTLRLIGSITFPDLGGHGRITITKQKPNNFLISTEVGDTLRNYGYNGNPEGRIWYESRNEATQEYSTGFMPTQDAQALLSERFLINALYSAAESGNAYKNLILQQASDGWSLKCIFSDRSQVLYTVNPKNFAIEEATFSSAPSAKGVIQARTERYSNFTNVLGLRFPRTVEEFEDGQPISTVNWEELQPNVEVFSSTFDPPQDAPQAAASDSEA